MNNSYDAIDLLKNDHQRLRDLLAKLAGHNVLEGAERERYLREIERELKMHAMVEEEIFYPAFKDATLEQRDRDMYYESIEEHHVVDMLLPELLTLDGSSEQFRAKARVLRELVEHHAEEEEKEMFDKAARIISSAKLQDLGNRIARRKEELAGQWDDLLAGTLRRVQAIADKFMPSSVKDLRVDMNRENRENRR